MSKKKGTLFSYPYALSPLITRNKNAIDTLEKEMSSFGFMQDDGWWYDLLGIISQLKKQVGLSSYVHESKPELERVANLSILLEE